MSNGVTQYYLNSEELQKVRSLLPKKDNDGTAAQKVARLAGGSPSAMYKVLRADYQNKEILYACCQVIVEDSEKKKALALSIMQKLNGAETRV